MKLRVYTLTAILIVTALQIAGPFYYGFGNWCNVIQYVSGFAFAGALGVAIHFAVHYYTVHVPRMKRIEEHLRKGNHNA